MIKNHRTNPLSLIFVAIMVLGLSISLQSLLAAWVSPVATPPNGNVVPASLDTSGLVKKVSPTVQSITGGIGIIGALSSNVLSVTGNINANDICIAGGKCLSTVSGGSLPDMSSYLNTGGTQYKSGGLGIGGSLVAYSGLSVYGGLTANAGIYSQSGRQILETNASDYLRINVGHVGSNGIALFGAVSIGENGLSVGDWTPRPQGYIYATNDVCLTNGKCLSSAGGGRLFGGMFTLEDQYQRGNYTYCITNPVTGGYSCPSGYTAYWAVRSRHAESTWGQVTYYCMK